MGTVVGDQKNEVCSLIPCDNYQMLQKNAWHLWDNTHCREVSFFSLVGTGPGVWCFKSVCSAVTWQWCTIHSLQSCGLHSFPFNFWGVGVNASATFGHQKSAKWNYTIEGQNWGAVPSQLKGVEVVGVGAVSCPVFVWRLVQAMPCSMTGHYLSVCP